MEPNFTEVVAPIATISTAHVGQVMDFQEVVNFSLEFLKKSRVVGNSVIRDLRSKSKTMPSAEWMEYFKGSIAPKTYEEIHKQYIEHSKHDYGFTPVGDVHLGVISSFYDDIFAV